MSFFHLIYVRKRSSVEPAHSEQPETRKDSLWENPENIWEGTVSLPQSECLNKPVWPSSDTKQSYMKHTYNDKKQQVKLLRRTARNVTAIPKKKDWVLVNKRANAAWLKFNYIWLPQNRCSQTDFCFTH